jgi:outer membrane lipoprotein SlyB
METKINKSMHPLMMVAGIAVILFSVAGVAAIMGWMPTSFGHSRDDAALDKLSGHGTRQASPAPVAQNAPAKVKCAECGVVESVRQVEQAGEGTGLGAAGGAVVGGLLGHQVGGGHGKELMTVVGAVGGAVAGNQIEKQVKSTTGYEITVRFDDGSSRVFASSTPNWRSGDKVKVVNGAIQSNA